MNVTAHHECLKFRNFEITADALVLHFHEESTRIPFSAIQSYELKWHLHEPIFAKKWWFLVLTVRLRNGEEIAGPVAFVNFNYLSNDRQTRSNIETRIADAIDAALAPPQRPIKQLGLTRRLASASPNVRLPRSSRDIRQVEAV